MDGFLASARLLHIAAGMLGLAMFWVPVLTRKGGTSHRRFGQAFKWSAYVALASASASVLLRWTEATLGGIRPGDDADSYGFLVFLAYLALITWVVIRHGVGVLEHKADLSKMNRPLDRTLARAAIASGVIVAAFALYYSPAMRWVLLALSPIGPLMGRDILRALSGRVPGPRAWLSEHIGAMLGAGIAFHTAFGVFGAARLFELPAGSLISVAPWILPTLIGVPAGALLTRKYVKGKGPVEARG